MFPAEIWSAYRVYEAPKWKAVRYPTRGGVM